MSTLRTSSNLFQIHRPDARRLLLSWILCIKQFRSLEFIFVFKLINKCKIPEMNSTLNCSKKLTLKCFLLLCEIKWHNMKQVIHLIVFSQIKPPVAFSVTQQSALMLK